ncbi:MAG: HD domain-containing phosphohydrolase [Treponemataceae bacterium]
MSERYIICVDDEAIITESLKRELRTGFPSMRVESAYSGEDALALLAEIAADSGEPAVLVTDERMPGMPGHVLLREARRQFPRLYGILLTGYSDVEAIAEAVNEAGLYRYIHKPWERRDLAMAVGRAAELYDRETELDSLRHRIDQLNMAMVAALENTAHEDDPGTYTHVQRVACYAALIGKKLGLPVSEVRKLYLYAPLHDIGKSGIPHDILAKPGKLSVEEFAVVKKHVSIGANLLKSVDIDPIARDLILYHHENWDGKGYLAELSGADIPLVARITALADVLDAMLCVRPYKAPLPFDIVAAEIAANSGRKFDPAVVDAFMSDLPLFRRVAEGEMNTICAEFRLEG